MKNHYKIWWFEKFVVILHFMKQFTHTRFWQPTPQREGGLSVCVIES